MRGDADHTSVLNIQIVDRAQVFAQTCNPHVNRLASRDFLACQRNRKNYSPTSNRILTEKLDQTLPSS